MGYFEPPNKNTFQSLFVVVEKMESRFDKGFLLDNKQDPLINKLNWNYLNIPFLYETTTVEQDFSKYNGIEPEF